MSDKRIFLNVEDGLVAIKITYEKWCDFMNVSSYHMNAEVEKQIRFFYPNTIID